MEIEEETMTVTQTHTSETNSPNKSRKAVKRNTFTLHCLGFIDYQPDSIESMSYHEASKMLLVARSNSSIELRKLPKFEILHTLRLNRAQEIRRLLWLSEKYFLVAHLNGTL